MRIDLTTIRPVFLYFIFAGFVLFVVGIQGCNHVIEGASQRRTATSNLPVEFLWKEDGRPRYLTAKQKGKYDILFWLSVSGLVIFNGSAVGGKIYEHRQLLRNALKNIIELASIS